MIDFSFVLIIAFWLFYCAFEGYNDATHYHRITWLGGEKDFDKHSIWSFSRGMVLGLLAIFFGYELLIVLPLMFPFIYLGMYALERNNLNKHVCTKRFLTHNKNMYKQLNIINRTIAFVLGLFLYIALN